MKSQLIVKLRGKHRKKLDDLYFLYRLCNFELVSQSTYSNYYYIYIVIRKKGKKKRKYIHNFLKQSVKNCNSVLAICFTGS